MTKVYYQSFKCILIGGEEGLVQVHFILGLITQNWMKKRYGILKYILN